MDVPPRQPTTPPVLPYASPAVPQGVSPAPAPVPAPPLTPEHLAQLAAARKLGTGLRRAVTIGKVDAWTTGIFGVITLAASIGSIAGVLLGAGMAILAVSQIRAADRLKQLDEKAPAALARNQIILGILLFAYGAVSLALFLRNPASAITSATTDPDMAQMLAPYADLVRTFIIMIYLSIMAIAVIGCGLTAMYYYAQRKRIAAYRSSTPAWILALQQAGVVI